MDIKRIKELIEKKFISPLEFEEIQKTEFKYIRNYSCEGWSEEYLGYKEFRIVFNDDKHWTEYPLYINYNKTYK